MESWFPYVEANKEGDIVGPASDLPGSQMACEHNLHATVAAARDVEHFVLLLGRGCDCRVMAACGRA